MSSRDIAKVIIPLLTPPQIPKPLVELKKYLARRWLLFLGSQATQVIATINPWSQTHPKVISRPRVPITLISFKMLLEMQIHQN